MASNEQTARNEFHDAMQAETTNEAATEAARRVAATLLATAEQVAEFEAVRIEDDIPIDRQLFSIGHVCQMFQLHPTPLRAAMKAAGVKFAEARNDVAYMDGKGIVALGRYLRELRDQARRATESN